MHHRKGKENKIFREKECGITILTIQWSTSTTFTTPQFSSKQFNTEGIPAEGQGTTLFSPGRTPQQRLGNPSMMLQHYELQHT